MVSAMQASCDQEEDTRRPAALKFGSRPPRDRTRGHEQQRGHSSTSQQSLIDLANSQPKEDGINDDAGAIAEHAEHA